jgi:hypothetical protein
VANECTTNAGSARVCQAVPVAKPVPPPPAPGVPAQFDRYFDTYYVFIAGTGCTSPTSHSCTGGPPASGSGVPLPTGGAFGAGVFGVIWQETNNCGGLQRATLGGCGMGADRMILV